MRVSGARLPIVLSKAKMQVAIEKSTRISRNNKVVKDTVLYNDDADYITVLFKYLATKLRKPKKLQVLRPKGLLN